MQRRTLFICITVFAIALGSFAQDVQAQYRSKQPSSKPDTGPYEFLIGFQTGSDLTIARPMEKAMTVPRGGSFVASIGWRPLQYCTVALGLVNSPNGSNALLPGNARLVSSETIYVLGASLATHFVQPLQQQGNALVMRLRGGGTYALNSTDVRMQSLAADAVVHEQDVARLRENAVFMAMDFGLKQFLGIAGTCFVSVQYSYRFPQWSGLPTGSDTQVSRGTLGIKLGIAP